MPNAPFRFRIASSALIALLVASVASAAPFYLRSDIGQPWGENTNEDAMDAVFGIGNWSDARYETVNTANLFSTPDFIFMEGGDSNADEMEAFLTANAAEINSFVNDGGVIFFNAAPNIGDGMTYGFGVDLVYDDNTGPFCNNDCDAVNAAHSIFQDLGFGIPGTSFGGNAFSHGHVSGALTALIQDTNTGEVLLAEQFVGNGLALFGSMTTTNFHDPEPGATILRQNILQYANANVSNVVPEPTSVLFMLGGLGALWVGRRRKQ